jgi:hypothetical protein
MPQRILWQNGAATHYVSEKGKPIESVPKIAIEPEPEVIKISDEQLKEVANKIALQILAMLSERENSMLHSRRSNDNFRHQEPGPEPISIDDKILDVGVSILGIESPNIPLGELVSTDDRIDIAKEKLKILLAKKKGL